jgi:micrococcal nuclease
VESSLLTNTPVALPTPPPPEQNTKPAPGNEAACIPDSPYQTGKVLNVLDGDTIKVMIDGKTFTVRYLGIDAPEYIKNKEYYSAEAWLKNSDLVYAKDITLYKEGSETDPLGRLLRYVKIGDIFVNFALVDQGFAKAIPNIPSAACDATFQRAQDLAMSAKIGMWGKP